MRNIVPAKLETGRVRHGYLASDPSFGMTGAFFVHGPCGAELKIIASDATMMEVCEGWEHVSVSTERRPPNWQEMSFVKDLFWGENECILQFHPPRSKYVNNHPFCLHLWKPPFEVPLPPVGLVGDPTKGKLSPAEVRRLIMAADA